MATQSASNSVLLRTFTVALLSTLVVAYTLPDVSRLWRSPGVMGFVADLNNDIVDVAANPSAVKAGIKDGDHIDIVATKPAGRLVAANAGVTRSPGDSATLAIVHNGQTREQTVISEPLTLTRPEEVLLAGRILAMLLFVGIGSALVLLRPSLATWGFYFYCLGLNGAPSVVSPTLVSAPWSWATLVFSEVMLPAAAFVGVTVFAVSFLHQHVSGWRAIILRLAPLGFVYLLVLEAYEFFGPNQYGWPAAKIGVVLALSLGAIALIAMVALVGTYIAARGTERQRIRWVVLAFAIALLAAVWGAVIPVGLVVVAYWVYAAGQLVGIIVPLTVAYAVIKHRVIDVSFVISRALVYTVLTTVLVGALSIIDWFFIEKLKLVKLGTIAEVGAAVAIGFWFNGLHRRVDAFIDATFFRQRYRAEQQLARDAAALPLAPTTAAIAHFLVDEPASTLSLGSAALFRRREGVFVREESRGWENDHLSRLDERDVPLLMLVQTENGPLSLYDHPWRADGVPQGPARPVLVLPIVIRRELTAVAFYGAHQHGEPLDPDETRALAQLGPAAAIAYDHLEAESMRRELQTMRGEIDALRSVIAEFQIQPT